MEFRHGGREIVVHTRRDANGHWDWSFVIRGHGHRQNTGDLVPTEGAAIDEAFAAAKREIDHLAADGND